MTANTITLSSSLLGANDVDPRWVTSPFFHLKTLAPKGKGKRFEQIAEAIFRQRDHKIDKPKNTDHDRIVDGAKFEIKGSTVTKGSDDNFSFLQVRPSQDYEFLVLETFWFDGTVKFHKIPKADVVALVANRTFVPQHGGNKGNSGTFCYNGNLQPFEQWYWFEVKVQ